MFHVLSDPIVMDIKMKRVKEFVSEKSAYSTFNIYKKRDKNIKPPPKLWRTQTE